MMSSNKRLDCIDIAKGIAIILVVWGHTGLVGANQINCFHMALFFVLSGYVFNCRDSVCRVIKKRIKSLYVPFVLFQIVFILFHNLFYNIGILASEYSIFDTICKIGRTILFDRTEQYLGPMWFLGTLFVASIVVIIIYKYISTEIRGGGYWIIALMLWSVGWYLALVGVGISWCNSLIISTALQGAAFIIIGIELRKSNCQFKSPFLAVLGLISVCCLNKGFGLEVDVRACRYSNPVFYFIAVAGGIYFVMYVSNQLTGKYIGEILSNIGKKTIWIMALHPLVFKMIGLFQVYMLGYPGDNLTTQRQVYAIGIWGLLYVIAGTVLPLFMAMICSKIVELSKRIGEGV